MNAMLKHLFLIIAIPILFNGCTTSYTHEQIEEMFAPITSKFGIEIVYEIDEKFTPIWAGGGGAHAEYDKLEPINKRVLARYPKILEEALSKYPAHVVKKYLNAVYFAGTIVDRGIYHAGTFDAFRRIVYLVDNGKWTDYRIATFHHEFSSLLLSRHGFLLNAWDDQHPEGFKYRSEIYDLIDQESMYAGITTISTDEDYADGFMNTYSHTNFENDFNEYAKKIFTEPAEFKRIMHQYPRVRGKFCVFLDFYRMVDPIFTEAYLLGSESETLEACPAPGAGGARAINVK